MQAARLSYLRQQPRALAAAAGGAAAWPSALWGLMGEGAAEAQRRRYAADAAPPGSSGDEDDAFEEEEDEEEECEEGRGARGEARARRLLERTQFVHDARLWALAGANHAVRDAWRNAEMNLKVRPRRLSLALCRCTHAACPSTLRPRSVRHPDVVSR